MAEWSQWRLAERVRAELRRFRVANPPKPVEQRLREGNPGHRPLPEPLLVAGRPDSREFAEPPEYLNELGRGFWRETVATLLGVGLLDRIDRPVLEMLTIQYCRVMEAREVVAREGTISLGSTGQPREHPALKIEREATRMFLRIASEYAMTPVARTRLGLADLHRRAMSAELDDALAVPDVDAVDAEVVEDDEDDVGLPGA